MARKRGSIRRRSADTYQLRVRLNGKLHETTVLAHDDDAANLALARWVIQLGEPPRGLDAERAMTMGEVAEHWFRVWSPTREKVTYVDAARRHLDHYVIRCFGDVPVRNMTKLVLTGFVADLASGAHSKSGKPLAPSTINSITVVFSAVLAHAIDLGLIETNAMLLVTNKPPIVNGLPNSRILGRRPPRRAARRA